MKNTILLLSLITSVATTYTASQMKDTSKMNEPLLVATLMIKDEATVIEKTLSELVSGGVKDIFVLDTGSTDDTQNLVKNFFKNNTVNGVLQEEKFVDFATSRNKTLELTEKAFPKVTFMLMLNANWSVRGVENLLKFCSETKYDDKPSYLVRVINYNDNNVGGYLMPRLFRVAEKVRYSGPVHEDVEKGKKSLFALPNSFYIDCMPHEQSQKKTEARLQRNEQILLKEHEQNPGDARTLFYLAQTYSDMGDFNKAYDYHKLRAAMDGNPEENYLTFYRLGLLTRMLWQQDGSHTWQESLDYLLKAHSIRPHRAEPLIRIAQHYMAEENRPMAYLFARRAIELPVPLGEIGLVELNLYSFDRFDILGTCAWNVGAYDVGEMAVREALKVNPDAKHLHDNMNLYVTRKMEVEKLVQEQQAKEVMANNSAVQDKTSSKEVK